MSVVPHASSPALVEGNAKDTFKFVSIFTDDGYFYNVAAGKKYFGRDIGMTADTRALLRRIPPEGWQGLLFSLLHRCSHSAGAAWRVHESASGAATLMRPAMSDADHRSGADQDTKYYLILLHSIPERPLTAEAVDQHAAQLRLSGGVRRLQADETAGDRSNEGSRR